METLLHEHENSEDTQSFLRQNGKKFSDDCVKAMRLMYQGVKLNGDTCKELYGFHDRRLRDCRQGRPDIVRSAWKKDADGKRLYVEFWISRPVPPSKQEAISWATQLLEEMKKGELAQTKLF